PRGPRSPGPLRSRPPRRYRSPGLPEVAWQARRAYRPACANHGRRSPARIARAAPEPQQGRGRRRRQLLRERQLAATFACLPSIDVSRSEMVLQQPFVDVVASGAVVGAVPDRVFVIQVWVNRRPDLTRRLALTRFELLHPVSPPIHRDDRVLSADERPS